MKPIKTAADIMTKGLVTIRWNQSLAEASELLKRHQIRHLPVMGEEGLLVGIISESDLGEPEATVSDCMNWPALTVDEEDSLRAVTLGMLQEKVSALLVTRNGNEVVGILTTDDLLRVLVDLLPEGQDQSFSLRNLPYSPVVHEALREIGSAGI